MKGVFHECSRAAGASAPQRDRDVHGAEPLHVEARLKSSLTQWGVSFWWQGLMIRSRVQEPCVLWTVSTLFITKSDVEYNCVIMSVFLLCFRASLIYI